MRREWLLDWDLGGRVIRVATAAVEVVSASGARYRYAEGLQPLEVSAEGLGGGAASVGIEIVTDTDWAEIEARGIPLEYRAMVLRRWEEGQELEAAEVWLRGVSADVEYGAAGEPLAVSMQRIGSEESSEVPPASARVDSRTWAQDQLGIGAAFTRDPQIEGCAYPIVIGHPGHMGSPPDPQVPALLVQEVGGNLNDSLLIAGHRVAATSIQIWDYSATPPATGTCPVSHAADGMGRVIAYCNLQGSAIAIRANVAKGRRYYTGWASGAAGTGGLVDPRSREVLRGVGSVIRWLLETYTTMQLDGASLESLEQYDTIKIDTFINDPVSAWDFVRSELLPLLPVVAVSGPRGLAFEAMRWSATAADAVAHLRIDGDQVSRVGGRLPSGEPIANEVSLEYCQDRVTGRFRRRVTVTGSPGSRVAAGDRVPEQDGGDFDSRVYGHAACERSQRLLALPGQERRVVPLALRSPHLVDPASAAQVALLRADAVALSRPRYLAELDESWSRRLRVGSAVLVSSDELHLGERVCLVRDIAIGGPLLRLELVGLEDAASRRLVG